MKNVQEKLDSIKIMCTRNQIEFLSTNKSIDNLLLDSTMNLYIFFYNDDLKVKQPDIYDAHIKFLIQLSRDTNGESQSKFVIVDMDLHPKASVQHEIKIIWYKNKQIQSTNLMKDKTHNNSSPNNFTGNYLYVSNKQILLYYNFNCFF